MGAQDAAVKQDALGRGGRSRSIKLAVINLPYPWAIVRRYSCTYYSAMFKLAPYELLQLATCCREWNGAELCFLDAIAKGSSEAEVHAFIARERPDMVVSLVGIETVSADLACMDRIKEAFPEITGVVFGYYPTTYPETVIEKTRVDVILRNEPERAFSAYLSARANEESFRGIPGLAMRDERGEIFLNPPERISDLDSLPAPDFGLCNVRDYEDWLLGGPCGVILSARGCPFACSYCATTFGRRLAAKKAETVVAEMKAMMAKGIRVVRFLDDTFTFDKKRVVAVCQGILREGLALRWSCLSRVDALDAEMLAWMKKAGCVRIAVGIESYSKKVLDYLDKSIDPAMVNRQLRLIRDAGIECAGTFLVGAPIETEEDFQETIRGVLDSPLDLIGVNIITPYGGTAFFERVKDDLVFSLIPYECRFKDESVVRAGLDRERRLYRRFFLRPSVILRQFRSVMRFPWQSLRLFVMLVRHGMIKRPAE